MSKSSGWEAPLQNAQLYQDITARKGIFLSPSSIPRAVLQGQQEAADKDQLTRFLSNLERSLPVPFITGEIMS